MAETTASAVAAWIVRYCHENGISDITNLKLQKLLYYAQAWHVTLYKGRPLFDDKIRAWVRGPVQGNVWAQYKHYTWNPILEPQDSTPVPAGLEFHLTEIMRVFGKYTGQKLEAMTHAEDPWKNARGGLKPDEAGRAEITTRAMRDYYSRLLAQTHESAQQI